MATFDRRCCRALAVLVMGSIVAVPVALAVAADTVEVWEPGDSEVDLYVDHAPRSGESSAAVMFGHGLTRGISAYVGATLAGVDGFAERTTGFYFGMLATLFDSDHVDVDVLVDVTETTGQATEISPGIELNLDADRDMASWGLYARVGAAAHAGALGGTVGAYQQVASGHQLLVEYHRQIAPRGGAKAGPGAIALGYNLALSGAVELVSQLQVTIPRPDERADYALLAGIIAALPATSTSVARYY